jgi:hippurate hydrolase
MQAIRRELHRCPEPCFEEHATGRVITRYLEQLGIPFRTGVAKTGIVSWIGKENDTLPCVALRADMDALPIEEKTGLPFASLNPGYMHACGHDGHMAMLLGAAALLKRHPLAGRVVLLFQPAEEGDGGARIMMEEGALEGVDAIFGGHIDRNYEVNQITVDPGLISAFTDEFRITIQGRGGHAAKPHETIDSIVVASQLVCCIQTLVSREINPAYPTVVTIGKISGGRASNVIAESAVLEGTIRNTHQATRQTVLSGLSRMAHAMEALNNVKVQVEMFPGYPPIINDETAAAIAREAAAAVVGQKGVVHQPHPSMGGEDFSFFLEKVPGCFVRFGARQRGNLPDGPAHSADFDFDERVLPIGAAFLARAAAISMEKIDLLRKTGRP